MIFTATKLDGVWRIDLELRRDDRGFFARTWCQREFAEHGIDSRCVQSNIAFNRQRGTLRGVHFNAHPHEEAKLVRCIRGALHCVVLDLRERSETREHWIAVELSADSHRGLWVPKGCALGYQTLADDTEVLYLMSDFYVPEAARGIRYDDPAFGFRWPLPVSVISAADQSWPPYHRS
jgi:dTDP-4-dehydrorhamnose 3,5-epimerase